MKVELFPFQETALEELRYKLSRALGEYQNTKRTQILSFTAPTGAGKTIVLTALIESVLFGNALYPEQPEAIFVWLSDSPELNEQSKQKVEAKSEKIRLNQCITISEESFNQEVFNDGHIYFLNTQKLSKSSNLTKHSNKREFTIWETLQNTIREKSDRLYFIIDEAHRGANNDDIEEATTIMQKFIKGSLQDNLQSMPVILGMSATTERFNKLVFSTPWTIQKVIVPVEDVRSSGLLKDRIVIKFPENNSTNKDMTVLQAATDEWKRKWDHWNLYSVEQHSAHVNPIFLIQVENKGKNEITKTDLNEALTIIQNKSGFKFEKGEVVHAFGDTRGDIIVKGLEIPYEEPSAINDNKKIKVVFFKESLSTGWDCPRAETMMSFRSVHDSTYIAQLLGRMIRTPLQRRVMVDESLNEVSLFLPHFNEVSVEEVLKGLQSSEGDSMPVEVVGDSIERPTHLTWTPNSSNSTKNKTIEFTAPEISGASSNSNIEKEDDFFFVPEEIDAIGRAEEGDDESVSSESHVKTSYDSDNENEIVDYNDIIRFINNSGMLNHEVRTLRINNYLTSMFKLLRFLILANLDKDTRERTIADIVAIIRTHVDSLKKAHLYDDLVNQVKEFKLSANIYDVFGRVIQDGEQPDLMNSYESTNADIDRQFRSAEARLGNEGIGQAYGHHYYDESSPNTYKFDVIIFASDDACIEQLHTYAERVFHELKDKYRKKTSQLPENLELQFNRIIRDGDAVSERNFKLPTFIHKYSNTDKTAHKDHLFSDNTNTAYIDLNDLEQPVLDEERKDPDYICWLRNPPRGKWALTLPYELHGDVKPMYPDFLIVRRDKFNKYAIDVLEPHESFLSDSVAKAKGLARYAQKNPGFDRIELIHGERDISRKIKPKRLNLSHSIIRDKVIKITSIDQLVSLFEQFGEYKN